MKYLVSIDGHLSTLLSKDGKYFYIITTSDGINAVHNYCDMFDLPSRNIKVDFRDKIINFDINWFNSNEPDDWSPQQLYLIEIEKL